MTYYWHKACAGWYYLWDGPLGTRDRKWHACVKRRPRGGYLLVKREMPDHEMHLERATTPSGAMRELETFFPGATFVRENC